ncbi:MAG: leucyl aminopeptidase [Candidatus Nanopelagicales bacterium]|nr:leucyl aminopeptidase [Candidatus Nanopelagicales bacterium]MDZ4250860.1 leucyl aminopeptidase [Candidatus Nanopelagicales bacterium]
MTALRLSIEAPADVDALVVFAIRSDGRMDLLVPPKTLGRAAERLIAQAASDLAPTGADTGPIRIPSSQRGPGRVTILTTIAAQPSSEDLRDAVGGTLRDTWGLARIAVLAPDSDPVTVACVAEGALLGAYRFDAYRGDSSDPDGPAPSEIILVVPTADDSPVKEAVAEATTVAAAVNLGRDLVNTPANNLNPAALASQADKLFKHTDVGVEILDQHDLRRGEFGGILAVGQGSHDGPRLIQLQHRHPKARLHTALVGKGITFDSGGLSLKPAKSMETMKHDMAGAACVLATVSAVSKLGLPINVTGWLAAAENMPGGSAQRPGDVIKIRGGKTVEVLNTDAEGRLVLADALARACEDSPDSIIDVATLTGAAMIALGMRTAAVMANDDGLRSRVVAAADAAGEDMWAMPMPEHLRAGLKSSVADLTNTGDRNGGMLAAGIFLREFIPRGTAWAHLDIAGPAFNPESRYGYTPKGGTGFGVRSLVELLRRQSLQD